MSARYCYKIIEIDAFHFSGSFESAREAQAFLTKHGKKAHVSVGWDDEVTLAVLDKDGIQTEKVVKADTWLIKDANTRSIIAFLTPTAFEDNFQEMPEECDDH